MVGTDRWAVHCFRLALQPPRFPQAISWAAAKDDAKTRIRLHSGQPPCTLRKPCDSGTKQNASSQPACRVRSALQMDSSCDELEACVPINAVLNAASPETFRDWATDSLAKPAA